MIKKLYLFFVLTMVSTVPLFAQTQFSAGTQIQVDGVNNSPAVVVTSREPVFSWQYDGIVSSFTVIVGSDVSLTTGQLWNFVGSTTTSNTINYVTRIKYSADGSAQPLAPGNTYYWQVTLYNGDEGQSQADHFYAVSSIVNLDRTKLDLAIDWNNPFNPALGQYTILRFTAKDRDRRVQLRVFTLNGMLVKQWPAQTALKDALYSENWDGRNEDGEVVARGIYLVNIVDTGDNEAVTRKVVVIKK